MKKIQCILTSFWRLWPIFDWFWLIFDVDVDFNDQKWSKSIRNNHILKLFDCFDHFLWISTHFWLNSNIFEYCKYFLIKFGFVFIDFVATNKFPVTKSYQKFDYNMICLWNNSKLCPKSIQWPKLSVFVRGFGFSDDKKRHL